MPESSIFKNVRRIELIAARLVEEILAGNYRSTFKGQGIEFDEVREYVAGDDMRAIDWNVTSRIGSPYTKIFREEREITLFLIVDVSASLYCGSGRIAKNELAAITFAILALAAVLNSDRVGAAFFSDRIERWVRPAKGRKHILRLINDLLSMKPVGSGSDLAGALKAAYRNLKRRGICVLISDFKTDDYWDELSLLARRHDCIAVRLFDPVDSALPAAGLLEWEDPESGDSLWAASASKTFRSQYESFWQEHHRRWLDGCRRRGVDALSLSSDEEPGPELFRFFQRRRRRS